MLFSRHRRDEATAAPEPEHFPSAPLDGPVRHDWADVPTIQTIAPGIDRTVDARFDAGLSSWQSPAVLRPLDHALSSDGPSGIVLDAIVRPALARPAPAFAGPPVQRSVTFDGPRRPGAVFSP